MAVIGSAIRSAPSIARRDILLIFTLQYTGQFINSVNTTEENGLMLHLNSLFSYVNDRLTSCKLRNLAAKFF